MNQTIKLNNPPVVESSWDGTWRGVIGSPEFPVEKDRYHLYASLFCPFAGRVLITREMKGLHEYLPVDFVLPYPKPWLFPATNDEYPGSTVDRLFHSKAMADIYHKVNPEQKERFSVPLLWDKKKNTIVNNQSEDIMRMLNTAFNDYLPENSPARSLNFYPQDLREKIDEINSWLVPDFNLGVYKAGFAADQAAYEPACIKVFETLDKISYILSNKLYLLGDKMTEVDLKLYCTLIRFDTIYVQHFKLNIGTIRHDYPVINRYLKHLYWKVPGFKEVTNFKHIKENYSKSHTDINPKRITPLGPRPDIEPWTQADEEWLQSLVNKVN